MADAMGNPLSVAVHAANIHDTKSGILPVREAAGKYPAIGRFCADAGYSKPFEEVAWDGLGLGSVFYGKIKPHECEKLPWRRVVGRTLPWLNHSRRLAKDVEIAADSAVAMILSVYIFC